MEKIKIEMQKCFDIYKILEEFNYRFSKDELDKRWIIFGSPEEITQMVEKRVKDLEKDKGSCAEVHGLNEGCTGRLQGNYRQPRKDDPKLPFVAGH